MVVRPSFSSWSRHLWDGRSWPRGNWFGQYLRARGVTDTAKVFHSFRHGFKDALRLGRVNQEIHDARTGHAQASTVSGGYGAKEMLARFGGVADGSCESCVSGAGPIAGPAARRCE